MKTLPRGFSSSILATLGLFQEATSHNTTPREQGREETPTPLMTGSGITSHPLGEGTNTSILAALRQGVISLGGSGVREQPPPVESPTEGLGLASRKLEASYLTTSLEGPLLYLQPPFPLLCPGRCSKPLGSNPLCDFTLFHTQQWSSTVLYSSCGAKVFSN